jgi:hypothetical protein
MHWIKKNYYKIFNKNKYDIIKKSVENSKKVKYFNSFFCKEIFKIRKKIKDKKILNFSHSGQIGDIIYALPVIYALSKKHICNLYINLNKSNKFINFKTYKMLYPLLRYQPYLNKVEKLKNQKIDINFDLFRKFPFACYNLNKIFLELAGVHFNLDKKFIFAKKHASSFFMSDKHTKKSADSLLRSCFARKATLNSRPTSTSPQDLLQAPQRR